MIRRQPKPSPIWRRVVYAGCSLCLAAVSLIRPARAGRRTRSLIANSPAGSLSLWKVCGICRTFIRNELRARGCRQGCGSRIGLRDNYRPRVRSVTRPLVVYSLHAGPPPASDQGPLFAREFFELPQIYRDLGLGLVRDGSRPRPRPARRVGLMPSLRKHRKIRTTATADRTVSRISRVV